MIRIIRQMDRAVAMLPLWLKIFIGLVLATEFIVITQWDRLTSKQPSISAAKVINSPPKQDPRFNFPEAATADKSKSEAIQAAVTKRLERITIADPLVRPNGTIFANGKTLYLYGIRPFDSRDLCTKASGERWACGLHAYAELRNSTAHKTINCDPKTILPNGVTAICTMEATDIAVALVRDGLARVDDTLAYKALLDAQKFAEDKKLGIWDR